MVGEVRPRHWALPPGECPDGEEKGVELGDEDHYQCGGGASFDSDPLVDGEIKIKLDV